MAGIKKDIAWFFSTSGDSPIAGFYKRFRNGSKPNQQTFENLTASVPFFKEDGSKASKDTGQALELKQGLVIVASDAKAKANDNTPDGDGTGALVVQPSQLPSVINGAGTEDTITTPMTNFSGVALTIAKDSTATRSQFKANLSSAFKTWLTSIFTSIDGAFTTFANSISTISTNLSNLTTTVGGHTTSITSNTNAITALGVKDRYKSTSTTNSLIGLGSRVLSFPAGQVLSFTTGTRVRATSAADDTYFQEGNIVEYDEAAHFIRFICDTIGGSGYRNDWIINIGGASPLTGNIYKATSSSSIAIVTGTTVIFAIGVGYSHYIGNRIRATDQADPANFVEGEVTDYSGGNITMLIDRIGGTGTKSSWFINLGSTGYSPKWIAITVITATDFSALDLYYAKDPFGRVIFKGRVRGDAGITGGQTQELFTLPAGFRPQIQYSVKTPAFNNTSATTQRSDCNLDVEVNGKVYLILGSVETNFNSYDFMLNPLTFIAEV